MRQRPRRACRLKACRASRRPIFVGRDVPFGDGTKPGRFAIAYLDAEAYPEADFIIIEQETPDVLWQPELLDASEWRHGAEVGDRRQRRPRCDDRTADAGPWRTGRLGLCAFIGGSRYPLGESPRALCRRARRAAGAEGRCRRFCGRRPRRDATALSTRRVFPSTANAGAIRVSPSEAAGAFVDFVEERDGDGPMKAAVIEKQGGAENIVWRDWPDPVPAADRGAGCACAPAASIISTSSCAAACRDSRCRCPSSPAATSPARSPASARRVG